jgi:hypothetical protein
MHKNGLEALDQILVILVSNRIHLTLLFGIIPEQRMECCEIAT